MMAFGAGLVVLLLEHARLAVNRHSNRANLFLPVHVVRAPTKQDEEATIREWPNAYKCFRSVDEQGIAVTARSGCGELVFHALVDEVDREDGLENVFAGRLSLLETSAILSHARFACEVGLCDCTANNGDHWIRTLGGQPLADELIEPGGCNCVLLESWSLQQLDKVFNSSPEISTNA